MRRTFSLWHYICTQHDGILIQFLDGTALSPHRNHRWACTFTMLRGEKASWSNWGHKGNRVPGLQFDDKGAHTLKICLVSLSSATSECSAAVWIQGMLFTPSPANSLCDHDLCKWTQLPSLHRDWGRAARGMDPELSSPAHCLIIFLCRDTLS